MQVVDTKDVRGACVINQGQSKFEMCGLGLEEGQSSSRSQVLQNATMWSKNDTTI